MEKVVQGDRIVTPKGRLSFPSLLKPDVGGKYSDGKFKATFIFDKSDPQVLEGLKALNAAAKAVAEKAFGAGVKVAMPFKSGDEKAEKNEYLRGKILITAKSKYRPGVVGPDPKVEITEEADLYAGCYVRASLVPFSYAQGNNRGVSFRLGNVQKLSEGEPFGGSRVEPTDEFGSVNGAISDESVPFDEDEDNLGL